MLATFVNVLFDGFLMGGIYALIAIGFSLQYGVARVLNISHGEFIMLGAFMTWWFFSRLFLNPLASLLITGPVIFFIGFFLYKTLFTALRKGSRAEFEASSLLLSFGLVFIIQNLAIILWGRDIRGYTFMASPVHFLGAIFAFNRILALVLSVAVGILFYVFLSRTRTGRAIRAAAQDPAVAELMGVNIRNVLSLCFGLGILMASVAGCLVSMMYEITPVMGLEYTIIAMIVVVLGGLGSIPGCFLSGFILGLVGSVVNYTQPGLALAVYYFLFIAILLIRPSGLFGR